MTPSQIIKRINLLSASATAIVVILSYFVANSITGLIHPASKEIGSLWAVISGIVVLQTNVKTTISLAGLRILGAFIGTVIGCSYLYIFPFNAWGMGITVFILLIICMLFNIPDNGRLATMNMVVIIIVSVISPDINPLMNGILRFIEAIIGSGLGIFLAWVILKITKRDKI